VNFHTLAKENLCVGQLVQEAGMWVRFEVSTAMTMKYYVFCDVTPWGIL
jgi:hypothetical protein